MDRKRGGKSVVDAELVVDDAQMALDRVGQASAGRVTSLAAYLARVFLDSFARLAIFRIETPTRSAGVESRSVVPR